MKPQLKAPLRDLLDDPSDEMTVERVRRRVSATRRVPGRRAAPALAAAVVLLAVGAGLYAFYGASDGPLELADGQLLGRVSGEADVELSDGSQLALGPGVVVETIENTGERVVLVQGDGRVVYEVRPGGPRRWSVDAGAVTVDVVGTRFIVDREGSRVSVSVERGRVRVRGPGVPGGLRTLERGDSTEVGARVAEAESTREPGVDAPLAEEPVAEAPARSEPAPAQPDIEDVPAAPTASPSTPEGAPRGAQPRWRRLAARGLYDEAFAALGEDGHREASQRARSVDELWALSDTARLSGHPTLAVAPLARIVAEHASSPRASVAALSLGRLQLDALNRPAEAARSLEQASELGLPAHLRETALARQVEAHRRAGHTARARTLAASYLVEYPDGRYRDAVRRGM